MNAPVSKSRIIKAACSITCFGLLGLLALKPCSIAQTDIPVGSKPRVEPNMDSLVDYRLLAQGHIEHEKYLLFEKAYRHWSQLVVMSRAKSVGPYLERIIDVPLEAVDKLVSEHHLTSSRHQLRYSESIWVRGKNFFLIRLSLVFDEGDDVEILAEYQPNSHQFVIRSSSWRICKPGEEVPGLSDK